MCLADELHGGHELKLRDALRSDVINPLEGVKPFDPVSSPWWTESVPMDPGRFAGTEARRSAMGTFRPWVSQRRRLTW